MQLPAVELRLLAHENEQWAPETGENCLHIFGDKGSFGFPNMDFYHYPDDTSEHYGWRHHLVKEHLRLSATTLWSQRWPISWT